MIAWIKCHWILKLIIFQKKSLLITHRNTDKKMSCIESGIQPNNPILKSLLCSFRQIKISLKIGRGNQWEIVVKYAVIWSLSTWNGILHHKFLWQTIPVMHTKFGGYSPSGYCHKVSLNPQTPSNLSMWYVNGPFSNLAILLPGPIICTTSGPDILICGLIIF